LSNKKATIKIGADVKEAQSGLDKVTSQLNQLNKQVKKSSITKFSQSFAAVTYSAKAVFQAIKAVNAAIKETTELYRVQAKAEKQLEIAAKNNPLLNSQSVKELKNFASELQSISTVGDEQLLPMMAQLASAGRSQEEIQHIMSAALDVSASGMMSLDSAVTALNKTYSGSVGLLGNQIDGLKTLTKEELQNGKAVDIVAAKFKGMAQETAEATGSSEQLKNAVGDLKEEFGASFEKAAAPVRKFFTNLISNWASSEKAAREYKEAAEEAAKIQAKRESGEATTAEEHLKELSRSQQVIEEMNASIAEQKRILTDPEYVKAKLKGMPGVSAEMLQKGAEVTIKNLEAQIRQERIHLSTLQQIVAKDEEIAKMEAAIAEGKSKAAEKAAAAAKLENDAAADKLAYEKSLTDYDTQVQRQRELGVEISKEEEMKGRIQLMQKGILELVEKENGVNWDNWQVQNDYIPALEEQLRLYKELYGAKADLLGLEEAEQMVSYSKEYLGIGSGGGKLSEQIDATLANLDAQRKLVDENSDAWAAYTKKFEELSDLRQKVVKKEAEEESAKTLESVRKVTSTISSLVTSFSDIVTGITEITAKAVEDQQNQELANAGKLYTDGLISYEEYCEKKGEANKKAAREQYKVDLWNYYANLLSAAANVAMGVTSSLSSYPMPLAAIFAAMTAAAGAVQISTIAANKPKAPSFATGGVVGGISGASMGSDNTYVHARTGEMILNAAQQAQLWKLANGNKSSGASQMNVQIINNNNSKVKTAMDGNLLKVYIDNQVNSSMAGGRYNGSLSAAQNLAAGGRVL